MIGLNIALTGCVIFLVVKFFKDEIKEIIISDGIESIIASAVVLGSFLSIPVGLIILIWMP